MPHTVPTAQAASQSPEDPRRWLLDTPLLGLNHPKIRLLAMRLTQLQPGTRQKALACFEYIRAMPFGCLPDCNSVPALTVLQRKRGDCHTKSTLFVALLRSIGIPSRLRFFTLRADFLRGVIDLGQLPIEHCCVEVLVNEHWVAVDSHVMDLPLANAALGRLKKENRRLGYGMHVSGSTSWDGVGQAFAPFSANDADSLPLRDWGPFDDPLQFYLSVPGKQGRLALMGRVNWMLGTRLINHRVSALRESALREGAERKPGGAPR